MTTSCRPLRGAARRFFAVSAALACAALIVASCSSDITPRAIPAADAGPNPTTATTTRPPPAQEDIDIDIDVEIGECVELGGTFDDADIDNATCGSPASNYKVIAKAPSGDECISDADQYYYETLRGVEQGALCLDVDWVVGGCMEVSGDDPVRADCATPGAETVRVVEILPGTTEVNDCSDPATSGYAYDERNFIVCVEDL
ncbi:hypothetical protein BJD99_03325 [Rhodococcus sp. 1163]|uniref:LppU family putative lipoprotein n=1 Tax=unclassified Rhodococcus (in: high G+C Gram-positive bacteria) TaxID=192944 RepID=UPI000A0654E9|nr:hypothetical protein [Rhodococcus sp. 1163]ORI20508.1 hypothetical protein BJD99_03325 [Rhodococcus sp. 1163]